MDREDWARMKTHSSDDFPPVRRPPSPGRRTSLDRDTLELIDSMVEESETYDDFRNSLRSQIDNSVRYEAFFDKHNLDQGFVETFSGRGTAIPNHVLNVLRRLSQVKVLNVTDDRKAIGEEEALKTAKSEDSKRGSRATGQNSRSWSLPYWALKSTHFLVSKHHAEALRQRN